MKVGDKLYCKKDYYYFNLICFHCGDEYLAKFDNASYTVAISCYNESFSTHVLCARSFLEHFLTLKEYRNIKLNKINESRR